VETGRRTALPDRAASGPVTPLLDRRVFIGTLAGALLAAPLAAEAQPAGKVYRIAYVSPGSRAEARVFDALRQGLRERELIEGHNLVIEQRYPEGNGVER
jgi:hypothetical protein